MQPLIVINTVGLTRRHLPLAPRLQKLAESNWSRPLEEILPAVTCSAQATMLTGALPHQHGIVGNGWFWRDTGEVRFWLQCNRQIQAEPLYRTARKQIDNFQCAKLFWWFNQGAAVDFSVTPKPHYGSDGNKIFDVSGTPEGLTDRLKRELGPFPFHTFWGPLAGLPSTQWIARCAAKIIQDYQPNLTLVYLPHLDYQPQRQDPNTCDWQKLVGELDKACEPLLDAAENCGARVWVVNEYTHVPVTNAVCLNRALRREGLLHVRRGPFGEILDTFTSKAFAVCDHQIAHLYLNDPQFLNAVTSVLASIKGVGQIYSGEERAQIGLNHPRAGDLVILSEPDAWFAYPFWLDDRMAPDYARTVNIHAKPGYDPCELFFDPALAMPKFRAMRRLLQKIMGFRTLFDVVPLDPNLVKGSHGLQVSNLEDRPLLIGDGPPPGEVVPMTAVRDLLLQALKH